MRPCMPAETVNDKRSHESEREQGRFLCEGLRGGKGGGRVVINLRNFKKSLEKESPSHLYAPIHTHRPHTHTHTRIQEQVREGLYLIFETIVLGHNDRYQDGLEARPWLGSSSLVETCFV